ATALGKADRLVDRFRHRLPLDQVPEGYGAFGFREDRTGLGIPFGDALAALDVLAILDAQSRAVLDAVDRPLGAVGIGHGDHDAPTHGNPVAVGVLDDGVLALGLDHDLAVEVRLDERLLGDLRRAADVERAHGELRARLADRLRRDHADRLAHVDRRAAGQIAPVASAAHTVDVLAREHGADLQLLHVGLDDRLDLRLAKQRIALDDDLAGRRIFHVLGRGTAEDADRQRGDHGAGGGDGAHRGTGPGAAILRPD